MVRNEVLSGYAGFDSAFVWILRVGGTVGLDFSKRIVASIQLSSSKVKSVCLLEVVPRGILWESLIWC